MKLYSYWRSSCSWRVRLGLEWKSLPYEYAAVHLIRDGGQQHAPGFESQSPLRQVPVLEVGRDETAFTLTQSVAILEYLEEAHPEPALLPRDTILRARVRQLVEMVNSGMQPLQNLYVLQEIERAGGDKKSWATHFIVRGLAALEARARQSAGKYLVGDDVTFADIVSIPQLYNARRFGVELSVYPTLLAAEAACQELPAFVRAHADAQPDKKEEP